VFNKIKHLEIKYSAIEETDERSQHIKGYQSKTTIKAYNTREFA